MIAATVRVFESDGHIEEGLIQKSKVVAASWGTELIQFFAALGIFHYRMIRRKGLIE